MRATVLNCSNGERVAHSASSWADSGVEAAGSPENAWTVNFFEDTYSPMNPSLPDESQWACHTAEYLGRDLVKNFLYAFYSQSTTTLARQTLTTYEHRSGGKGRVSS